MTLFGCFLLHCESDHCKQTDGIVFCKGCNVGYHLTGTSCEPNVCKCETGNWIGIENNGPGINATPKIAEECVYHGSEACDVCPSGFHIMNMEISIPELYQDSVGASGLRQFESTLCQPNICFCENGIPHEFSQFDETGWYRLAGISFCEINGDHVCQSCDYGYHFEENTCLPNICMCPNGTPEVNDA